MDKVQENVAADVLHIDQCSHLNVGMTLPYWTTTHVELGRLISLQYVR